jgi:hypothetical protein
VEDSKGDAFAKAIKTQMPILFIGTDMRAKRVGHWALQVEAYFETCHCGQHGLILNGIVFVSRPCDKIVDNTKKCQIGLDQDAIFE